jgi:hypothetical protein
MTLFPTDSVLLEVRNQNERCHARSPVAMTSHVRTLSMLFFKTRRTQALPYSFQVSTIRLGFACGCPTSVGYTPCFLLSSSYAPQSSLCASYSEVMTSFIIFRPPLLVGISGWGFWGGGGGGCNTPCYGNFSQVTLVAIKSQGQSKSSH